MPLVNVWSFPSRLMGYEATLDAMKALAVRIARILAEYKEPGHPIDITWALESAYFKAAPEAAQDLKLAEPIPRLCTLVVASAFDAALHDGFGKVYMDGLKIPTDRFWRCASTSPSRLHKTKM